MPRGESRTMGTTTRTFGATCPGGPPPPREESTAAIRRVVQAFAEAWYWGEAPGMLRCLHPDYVNRLISLGAEARPLGVQGALGAQTPADRRTLDVRILELRSGSASAVAEVAGWVIHLHLARSSGQWKIVNAMWEMPS